MATTVIGTVWAPLERAGEGSGGREGGRLTHYGQSGQLVEAAEPFLSGGGALGGKTGGSGTIQVANHLVA